MYTAPRNFRKTLREGGHRGTSITIYNFDGALVDSTVRKLKAFHHSYYEPSRAILDDDAADLKRTDIVVENRCKTHAAHKACEWGVKILALGDGTCKETPTDNAHIGIKSARNSSTSLFNRIDAWLISRRVLGRCIFTV